MLRQGCAKLGPSSSFFFRAIDRDREKGFFTSSRSHSSFTFLQNFFSLTHTKPPSAPQLFFRKKFRGRTSVCRFFFFSLVYFLLFLRAKRPLLVRPTRKRGNAKSPQLSSSRKKIILGPETFFLEFPHKREREMYGGEFIPERRGGGGERQENVDVKQTLLEGK